MDSALRPREIQARIRSGQSLEEVAGEAGVPAERIEAYAAPVIAEREHVARMALAATVRRRGETSAHRNLRPVVEQRLTGVGVDPDGVDWDAWREEDRRWSVRARYELHGERRDGLFRYDQAGRFSVALNDDARWLIAEPTREQEDSDELALVRAVSSSDDVEAGTVDGSGADGSATEPEEPPVVASSAEEAEEAEEAEPEGLPTSAATPQEIASEVEAEIDSYGVVPDGRSELDVLYDMLGGMAEDSINIYAGLSEPVLGEAQRPPEQVVEVTEVEVVEVTEVDAEIAEDDEPTNVRIPRPAAATDPTAGRPEDEGAEDAQPIRQPSARSTRSTPRPKPLAEPEQPSLVDHLDEEESAKNPAQTGKNEGTDQAAPEQPAKPAAKQRKSRKRRASVPSWDEIMFGGPPPNPKE